MFTKLNLSILFCYFSLQPCNFNIISIHDLLKIHPDIEYIKCHETESFEYNPFPISRFPELQPNKGLLSETFIAKIPHGQACSVYGWIKLNNHIISDSFPPYHSLETQIQTIDKKSFENVIKITGKVAVITMNFDYCYFHWVYNILGRLALLEQQQIDYDWLYVAYDKPYMKEMLTLWGINPAKIIQPFGNMKCIEADELIVPSHMGARTPELHQYCANWIPLEIYYQKWNIDSKNKPFIGSNIKSPYSIIPPNISIENIYTRWAGLCSMYYHQNILNFLQNKLLSCLDLKTKNNFFCKKVFISRKDARIRNMINEDEIFKLFEQKGFVRYSLATLSILEQIELFNGADIIVAAHGAALTNILFCKPNTHIIEIFQARSESCFYYLSQHLNLHHHCIKTMDFNSLEGQIHTSVDPNIIQNFINQHETLFNS